MMARVLVLAMTLVQLAGCSALAASGVGDPSDVADPTVVARLWRAYSRISPSANAGNLLVTVVLARSDDGGLGWGDQQVLAVGRDLGGGLTEFNETPTLTWDGGAGVWVVIWDHRLASGGVVLAGEEWLGVKTTPGLGLGFGAEAKLVAGTTYDAGNSFAPGATQFALPPQLADCVQLQEPSGLTSSGGYFLSVDCVTAAGARRVELLERQHGPEALVWRGTLLGHDDILAFGQAYGGVYPQLKDFRVFTESNMLSLRGENWLLVSPVIFNPSPHNFGCVVFKIQDLATASLVRLSPLDSPWVFQYVSQVQDTGACTWAGVEETGGIQVSRFDSVSGSLTISPTRGYIQ